MEAGRPGRDWCPPGIWSGEALAAQSRARPLWKEDGVRFGSCRDRELPLDEGCEKEIKKDGLQLPVSGEYWGQEPAERAKVLLWCGTEPIYYVNNQKIMNGEWRGAVTQTQD